MPIVSKVLLCTRYECTVTAKSAHIRLTEIVIVIADKIG